MAPLTCQDTKLRKVRFQLQTKLRQSTSKGKEFSARVSVYEIWCPDFRKTLRKSLHFIDSSNRLSSQCPVNWPSDETVRKNIASSQLVFNVPCLVVALWFFGALSAARFSFSDVLVFLQIW